MRAASLIETCKVMHAEIGIENCHPILKQTETVMQKEHGLDSPRLYHGHSLIWQRLSLLKEGVYLWRNDVIVSTLWDRDSESVTMPTFQFHYDLIVHQKIIEDILSQLSAVSLFQLTLDALLG